MIIWKWYIKKLFLFWKWCILKETKKKRKKKLLKRKFSNNFCSLILTINFNLIFFFRIFDLFSMMKSTIHSNKWSYLSIIRCALETQFDRATILSQMVRRNKKKDLPQTDAFRKGPIEITIWTQQIFFCRVHSFRYYKKNV